MNQNFKTPIEDIFFRSSKIGLIAGGLIRHGLTEKQREKMQLLEALKVIPQGLSEKQQEELEKLEAKQSEGKILTPSQIEKLEDYKKRLTTPKPLTENQQAELQELRERNAKKPELSKGAKTYINEVWLENEKGFKEEVTDKKLRKGTQGEEDAISLISFVDGIMYTKNKKRIYKDHITGECDVLTDFKDLPLKDQVFDNVRVIDDTKCSWNPRTFMNAEMTVLYEWQGRAYMYLYDADLFRLRHCLVDCPPDVYADEYRKFCFQHNIIDDTLPEYQEALQQFRINHIYTEGNYTQEERVKTFTIYRDYELEEILLLSVKLAVEYYKTITLNQKNDE